ncbi:sulfur carrier protein ThiS [Metallumcola ferriviriculae]|uniref:Sulfur carrier protein ThiS n=1 Tax=Metallumcola ferriviriculae TaxID=3039180 RepID=A0AAU0URE2_9FIRM|nr:sulfur carrier protein ThiS [Desulfitibacteraceae bacterium MK1]
MNVKINGDDKQLEKEASILELLEIEQVKMPDMVSVELNGDIVDREKFETTIIKENDRVEFLYFMGGGAIGL